MAIVEWCSDIYYSKDLVNCQECMFCIGLRNKKYCILNKQYSKQEYFEKKEALIDELKQQWTWGHYPWFDLEMQDHPYNDTLAYDYFKVQKVIAVDGTETLIDPDALWIVTLKSDDFLAPATLDLGGEQTVDIIWRTREQEINIPEGMDTMRATDLPSAHEASDDLIGKAIICEHSGRPYRIIREEIEFCKKYSLPLPRLHHQVRLDDLLASRPIGQMHVGKSDISWEDMLTVYKHTPEWTVCSPDEYRERMYG